MGIVWDHFQGHLHTSSRGHKHQNCIEWPIQWWYTKLYPFLKAQRLREDSVDYQISCYVIALSFNDIFKYRITTLRMRIPLYCVLHSHAVWLWIILQQSYNTVSLYWEKNRKHGYSLIKVFNFMWSAFSINYSVEGIWNWGSLWIIHLLGDGGYFSSHVILLMKAFIVFNVFCTECKNSFLSVLVHDNHTHATDAMDQVFNLPRFLSSLLRWWAFWH